MYKYYNKIVQYIKLIIKKKILIDIINKIINQNNHKLQIYLNNQYKYYKFIKLVFK